MRVIITGCNGLLGQKLIRQSPNNAQICGLDLHSESFAEDNKLEYRMQDITNRSAIKELVLDFQPDWIVNTAALTNVDACEDEKEKCWQLNVKAIDNLIYAASKNNARVIQLSTDYVFDGRNGPYNEESIPHPICYYGKSKLASENIVRIGGEHHVIVRTAVLYGAGTRVRPNFVTWLLDRLAAKKALRIVDDQISNTTFVNELADSIWRILSTGESGIFHLTGKEIISRFDFARMVAKVFDLDADLIQRSKTEQLAQKAPRPLFSGLSVDKALHTLGVELSDAKGGLLKLRQELE